MSARNCEKFNAFFSKILVDIDDVGRIGRYISISILVDIAVNIENTG